MNVLDLFSGIGGFPEGLQRAGIEINNHFYSEIDKHAKAIYQYQFKNTEYIGSVEHVRDSGIDRPNIITFGSPCQDFSIAGKRAGMGGARSSLITYPIELITKFRPEFFIWENVKGTFSSNDGADFWAIIQAFANIGGYRLEWQLLNTAWFLPQNRERIYLVGALGNRSGRQIFPITEANHVIDEKRQRFSGQLRADKHTANCLTSSMHKMSRTDNYVSVTPVLTPDRNEKLQNGRRFKDAGEPSFTLTAQDKHGVMIQQKPRGNNKGGDFENCPTISSSGFEHNNHVMYSMGNSKPGRSCIGAQRVPEIGDSEKSIRRLTEIECERLQGFEDDYTKYGIYDGEIKEVAPTHRYRCLGNAVTVDVVEAIGRRLAA